MSVKVSSYVWDFSPSTLGARLIMLYLADKAHDDGTNAYPSIASIARDTRLSERQVQRQLKALLEDGELIEEGKSIVHTRQFRIPMPKMSPRQIVTPDIYDTKGVTSCPERVSQMSPDPLSDPSDQPLLGSPTNNQKRSRHRSRSEIPTDFALTNEDRYFADKREVSWKTEFARFENYHRSKGSTMADWHAAWRTWVLNQERWAKERAAFEPEPDHGVPSAAELMKRWNGNAK